MDICNINKLLCSNCKTKCEHRIKDDELRELRCKKCGKLLGKIIKNYKIGYIELKCTKCKTLNIYKD